MTNTKSFHKKNYMEVNGRLVRDPKKVEIKSDKSKSLFTLALEEGGYVDYPSFVAWGEQAEKILEAKKGEEIFLTGKVKTRKFETEDGTKYTQDLVATSVKVLR
jgi:single-strand DNA-binding protein